MRKIVTLSSILSCFVVFMGCAQNKVDDKANQLKDKLLSTIGGKDIWKNAGAIKVELIGHYVIEEVPWREKFWLDYEKPRGKYEIKSETTDRLIAWTTQNGWELKDGNFEYQEASRHKVEMEYYHSEPTVVFHKIAKDDSDIILGIDSTDSALRKLVVMDKITKDTLCTIGVNLKSEPIYWSTKLGDRKIERVLGPLQDFGDDVRLFSWGASPDGKWRYEHISISLLESVPDQITFDPPQ